MLAKLKKRLQRRAIAWAEKRQGLDPNPVTLERRRVYILPTRSGFLYGAMLFAMLLGSMNYSNSMAFILTFFLSSLGLVAMHHAHRNLESIVLRGGRADPVFAGQRANFQIVAVNHGKIPRYGITLSHAERVSARTDVPNGSQAILPLEVRTLQRGLFRPGRFSVSTAFPFGLFRAWAWVRMDIACVVYPQPAEHAPAPPPVATDTGGMHVDDTGNDDFSGLRDYRQGDTPRHIAWKASARLQNDLLVKQFQGGGATRHMFEWETLSDFNVEERLSILTRWILDAETEGETYGLQLLNRFIAPGHGKDHRHECLMALALFDGNAMAAAA